ncbi:hypothetical protein [Streptomyces sp. V3I7]|uniref:LppU/SCO3897 family protein n=1 Tax=Streptomyces sp. V3I7 TaxID=3042278 RepID=UPI00278ACB7B|nr:hypothetical protein [Streptomyces sp. V3I7]MDQ0991864.1 hypothetical protein [Streptomyces sp. V3I7]
MTTPPPHGQSPYAQTPPPSPGAAPYTQAPPPPGQPTGQPGVPPQAPYAPFPNQGAPVPPPSAPAKSGRKKFLRFVGVVVVAVIVGILKFGAGWFLTRDDAETTAVGSCMHNDGSYSKPDLNEVDCTSHDSQYEVVQKFDDSSDEEKCKSVTESTIYYVQSGGGHDVVLCLKETK